MYLKTSRFPRFLLPALLTLLLCALPGQLLAADGGDADAFVAAIEDAHGAEAWRSHAAFEAEITVEFGGQQMIDGTMLTTIDGGKVRFELKDGTVLIWDGTSAWTSPTDSAFQGTRFHVLTWPYFLLSPLKLQDPGSHLEVLGKLPLRDGEKAAAARLTFDSGVGDTPDDWYVAYRDGDHRLAAMSYIVTFGKSVADAEKEPHAIAYGGFTTVDGALVPLRWSFWNWNEDEGIHGEQLGEVVLSNPRFVDPSLSAFVPGGSAREEMAPGP